jgi:hypothetical protein
LQLLNDADILLLVRTLEIISLALGIAIAYFAYRAHLRNKSRSLLLLSIGFFALAAGSIAEGVLFEFLNFTLLEAEAVRAVLTIGGFLLILYSIKSLK